MLVLLLQAWAAAVSVLLHLLQVLLALAVVGVLLLHLLKFFLTLAFLSCLPRLGLRVSHVRR